MKESYRKGVANHPDPELDNPKRARSGKPRTQPRDCAYVHPPDLQRAPQQIRRAACSRRAALPAPHALDLDQRLRVTTRGRSPVR